jgi:Na+/H+ antiporter NhaB
LLCKLSVFIVTLLVHFTAINQDPFAVVVVVKLQCIKHQLQKKALFWKYTALLERIKNNVFVNPVVWFCNIRTGVKPVQPETRAAHWRPSFVPLTLTRYFSLKLKL